MKIRRMQHENLETFSHQLDGHSRTQAPEKSTHHFRASDYYGRGFLEAIMLKCEDKYEVIKPFKSSIGFDLYPGDIVTIWASYVYFHDVSVDHSTSPTFFTNITDSQLLNFCRPVESKDYPLDISIYICECGSEKCGHPGHSSWCPKYAA